MDGSSFLKAFSPTAVRFQLEMASGCGLAEVQWPAGPGWGSVLHTLGVQKCFHCTIWWALQCIFFAGISQRWYSKCSNMDQETLQLQVPLLTGSTASLRKGTAICTPTRSIFLLGQWLTGFELLGIPYLVGKIKFKLFFSGSRTAKWVLVQFAHALDQVDHTVSRECSWIEQWKRAPGCVGYMEGYTAQLYGDYNKPL